VFTRSSGVWTQQGKKLVGTGFVGRAHRGMSVALSADGNIAIVGGFVEDGAAGIGVHPPRRSLDVGQETGWHRRYRKVSTLGRDVG
jgi:hypothetical protein